MGLFWIKYGFHNPYFHYPSVSVDFAVHPYVILWAVFFVFTGMLLLSVSPPVWAKLSSISSDDHTCIVNMYKNIAFLFHLQTTLSESSFVLI